jgi:SAM-dependent methyltransferase
MGMSITDWATAVSDALQRWLVPELRYSQASYEEHVRKHASGVASWLDIGCGHHLLPPWRAVAERELLAPVPLVIGVDYDLPSLARHRSLRNRVRADISFLPFQDASFDLASANMVVEHLRDPAIQFREIARILKPGGTFLFHTPNLNGYPARISRLLPGRTKTALAWLLEGRREEDVFPTHYRANTEAAIRDIATRSGLYLAEFHFTGSLPSAGRLPPVALVELLYLRQLMRRPELARFRQTIICVLRKPQV